jgi:heptosyltransferase I
MWRLESKCRCKILFMKIAIVKLSALGDIIHAMVVLQFIKKYKTTIEVDWIVEESYKGLVEFHPDINKVHVVNLKKVKKKKSIFLLINELRKVRKFGSYDLVIDMQGLLKSAVISHLLSSPVTLGFEKSSIREGIASIFYNKTFKYGYDENVIKRNFELIKFALELPFNNEEIHYKLPFLFPSQKHLIPGLSSFKKNILIIPGASFKSKCYPVEKFAEVTTEIDENFLISWGNQKEKILADKIKLLSPKVIICEKLSLDALISLISQVDFVLGSDTGPTHMAWALNKSSINLFGSTPGHRNSYITKNNRIIESNSEVNPYKIDKNDYSIEDIDVQEIVQVYEDLLKQ